MKKGVTSTMSTKVMRRTHVNLNLSRFTSVNCQFTVNWWFTMVYNNLHEVQDQVRSFFTKDQKLKKKKVLPPVSSKVMRRTHVNFNLSSLQLQTAKV